ncbi:MAG: HAMP domain-containing protein [Nocardiopsaceae bacterium]|jgi:signal transduction histidine kinase|nr:HAMP domain-containing protein [Nocardiopsaceae bacterium]
MTHTVRIPIKFWVTAAFSVSVACVIAGLSVFVFWRTGADLLTTIDAGLRSRAEVLAASVQHGDPVPHIRPTLIEGDEVFAQITDPAGRIIRSSPVLAGRPLVSPAQAQSARRSELFDRTIPEVDNVARILLVPVNTSRGRMAVMVGVSLQDRRDEMTQLATTLAISGAVAVCLLCAGSWLALASALRPVEHMRLQAAGISETGSESRLTPIRGSDEITRLGRTLNQMLDRIDDSVERERRLIDRTSHELRTPLAIQRIDLDLALSGKQSAEELAAALASVSEENEHLTRLTSDLLILARARGGSLPVQLAETTLTELLDDARTKISAAFRNGAGAHIAYETADALVRVDGAWFRQAVINLVDNAVRHTPPEGRVDVRIGHDDGAVTLVVEDTGPGFDDQFLRQAFEPFARRCAAEASSGSSGLGLTIVQAIAEAHGGRVWAENRPEGGSRVTMVVKDGLPATDTTRPT